MKKIWFLAFSVLLLGITSSGLSDDTLELRARLRSFTEVPPVSSPGSGSFRATISADRTTITFELTFQDLNAPAVMSHIHFGFPKEAAGVMIWF